MRKTAATFRFSPRPRGQSRVRKWYWNASGSYITDSAQRVETRDLLAEFAIDFQSGDHLTAQHEYDGEFLPAPFRIAPPIALPIGNYALETSRVGYTLGPQRTFSGSVLVEDGSFYGGHRSAVSLTAGRTNVGLRLSMEPTSSVTHIRLPDGEFTDTLAGSRVTYTLTPELFVSALVQYNSAANTVSTNARLRWEYRPGSEFFVVYTDERNTLGTANVGNRALVLKVNRLFKP